MILDYVPRTKAFTLKVNRFEADVRSIMEQHGLDLSTPLSTPDTATLYTYEPFAAVAFYEHATPAAVAQLAGLQEQIDKSWAKESTRHIDVPADKELAAFQVAGVDYCLNRSDALIGDQPGLGKTMQAIAISNEIQAERTLVLCPANIRLQWC